MSVSAQTVFILPVQELQAEIGNHFQDHSLGCSGGGTGLSSSGHTLAAWQRAFPEGPSRPVRLLITNTSNHGWVAILDGRRFAGTWTQKSQQKSHYNVNIPETSAVLRVLQFFQESSAQDPPGSDGQHHHPFQSELDGGSQVPFSRPVSSGDHSVVPR